MAPVGFPRTAWDFFGLKRLFTRLPYRIVEDLVKAECAYYGIARPYNNNVNRHIRTNLVCDTGQVFETDWVCGIGGQLEAGPVDVAQKFRTLAKRARAINYRIDLEVAFSYDRTDQFITTARVLLNLFPDEEGFNGFIIRGGVARRTFRKPGEAAQCIKHILRGTKDGW